MAVAARFIKQRRVRRGVMVARFKGQRRNWRGSTKSAAPVVSSISPSTAVAVTGAVFTLTVTGTGFVSGVSRITFNGTGLPTTTFVSDTSLTTSVNPANVPAAQTVQVNVMNNTVPSTTPKPFTFTAT